MNQMEWLRSGASKKEFNRMDVDIFLNNYVQADSHTVHRVEFEI